MAIVDMKRGDAYIVRAYRGEDLIFQRGNPYIERTDDYINTDPEYSVDTYIHVDDVELMYNWTYEAEVSGLQDNPQNRLWSFLGGSFEYYNDGWNWEYWKGLFFGYKQDYSTDDIYESILTRNNIRRTDTQKNQSATPIAKHIVTMKLDSIPSDHYGDNIYQATNGGFHLLGSRDCRDGTAINKYLLSGSLYKNKGRVYRISLYDENNALIHNYIPNIVDNHKGMLDTVINKFYACSDDTKFNVGLG